MNAIQAVNAIVAKLKDSRPAKCEYLRRMAKVSEMTSEEWKQAGGFEQQHYRNGMAYAYRDTERMLEDGAFKEEV